MGEDIQTRWSKIERGIMDNIESIWGEVDDTQRDEREQKTLDELWKERIQKNKEMAEYIEDEVLAKVDNQGFDKKEGWIAMGGRRKNQKLCG